MNPGLIIFDCDGVLIDSEPLTCRIVARELSKRDMPISADEISQRFNGIPSGDMFAELQAQYNKTLPKDFGRNVESCVIDEYHRTLKPIAGVAETVPKLTMRSCVASSSRPQKLCIGLMQTGLFDLFYPEIYSTSMVPRGKPAPDIFLYAAERMRTRPAKCIVVEDSVAGVQGASEAGMRVLGFTGGSHCWDGHADELMTAGAEGVVTRFTDLPAAL